MATPRRPHNYTTDEHLDENRGPDTSERNGPNPTFRSDQIQSYNASRDALKAAEGQGQKGGRIKGIVPKIREITDDFHKLLEFWASVAFTGEYQGKAFGNRERIQCSELLAIRGMGKPVEAHVLVDARNVNANGEIELSNEQLTRLVYALAPPPGSPVPSNTSVGAVRAAAEVPDYSAALPGGAVDAVQGYAIDGTVLEVRAEAPEEPLDADVVASSEAADALEGE